LEMGVSLFAQFCLDHNPINPSCSGWDDSHKSPRTAFSIEMVSHVLFA
jgi:hypothetical protein